MNAHDLASTLEDIDEPNAIVEIELTNHDRVAIRSVTPKTRDGQRVIVIRCRSSL